MGSEMCIRDSLKRAGIYDKILLEVYKVMLRPLLEYCAPVYNSMLTSEQAENLERQQRRALKIIHGFEHSYEELLEKTGLERLSERRKQACDIFTNKLAESERFGNLFEEIQYPEEMVTLRKQKRFREEFAKSTRLYNSPLYAMRRLMNNQEENLNVVHNSS